MGGGSYSYIDSRSRATAYSHMSREQVFTKREMDPEMNIKDKVRECRDTDEHPNTVPIIIGLDVTGSMGDVPQTLITESFPDIMENIIEAGVKDPQVLFVGIGDYECDDAPVQVGQFESSDELTEKWLKSIYIEEGGGGNSGESYNVAWYVAARHTDCDAITKRGKKGILITIGDEPCLKSMDKRTGQKLFGSVQNDVLTSAILKEAQKGWDVYHINVPTYSGQRRVTKDYWKHLLGDHCIQAQSKSADQITTLISDIILQSVGTPTEKVTETTKTEVIL